MKKQWLPLLCFLSACNSSKKAVIPAFLGVPDCIVQKIQLFKEQPVQNPPRSIYTYTYNNKTVYYIPPVCCDQFSDLYDDNCVLLGHPDGGFTGKGDGQVKDFSSTKTSEKLIWKDERDK